MAESPLSEKLQLMLNEEKWTRTLMANYSVASLKELDRFIDETTAQGIADDIIKVCTDHLSQTKNSVIALYVAGVLNIMRQPADESYLVQLMDLFADSKKNNIIEYICNRMLDFGENRIALTRLAECYTDENKIEQRYAVWERLVRIDTEEAELAQLIAEWKEKNGESEDAIDFYKKALIRYINKGLFANIKEIWVKLIELSPEDLDFFLHAQKKIAKQISPEKAAMLLMDLYAWYKKSEKWEIALNILKLIIEYDERNPALRKEFLDCYTAIYSGHSMFDECVRLSNLTQTYRSLHEAIADFERRIAFDKGNYVFHRTWNIGRISNITNDEVVVDFAKSRNHHMSLKMAFDSLTTLSKDHIWVLKATWPREKLRDKVKADPAWAIKIIIKSFDGRADMKRIKAELVPSVLSPSEWNSWSSRAKDILKTDPMFGNAQDDISTFIVRDRPLSFEEKIYAQFKAEKSFFARVQFLREYIEMSNDLDTDYFEDMLSYFVSFLKLTQANEFMVGAYLLVKELSGRYPRLQQHVTMRFADLFVQIKDSIVPIYLSLKDTELRNQFIQNIKTFVSNWPDIYIQLLPYARSSKMLDALESAGQEEKLKRMAMYVVENYKDMREAFIWLAKDLKDKPWLKELGIVREKIILTLLHILDITFKEIDSHKDTTENRKINRLVQNILFKEKDLEEFLDEAPQQVTERVYSMLADIKEVDPAIKLMASYPTPELLRSAGKYLDYVCPHHYGCANLGAMLGNIAEVRAMIAANAPGRHIRLGITEWNTTAGDWGPPRAMLWTLANALACARYHNLMHRHADVIEIANRSNLTNSFCSGILQTDNRRLYKTPAYYAQMLYATKAGSIPLVVDSLAPADSGIDFSATLSSDGRKLVVFVVNDGPSDETRSVDPTPAGKFRGAPSITVLADRDRAGEPDATNTFERPDRIVPPRARSDLAAPDGRCTFPAYSLTVLEWHSR